MSPASIVNRLVSAAFGVAIFSALLSPATATSREGNAAVFPDVSISAASDGAPISRLPWLAPAGHRQPRQADVPPPDAVSAWEHRQQQLDRELDRKLIICKGC